MTDEMISPMDKSETAERNFPFWEVAIAVVLGLFVIITFVGALSDFTEHYALPQIKEAKTVFRLIAEKFKDKDKLQEFAKIKEGETLGTFAAKIGLNPDDVQLKHLRLGDFVFHKGGGKPNPETHKAFYIEAKPEKNIVAGIDNRPDVKANIAVRLYSDGEIKVIDLSK